MYLFLRARVISSRSLKGKVFGMAVDVIKASLRRWDLFKEFH